MNLIGVAEQVEQHAVEPHRIACHRHRDVGAGRERQREPLRLRLRPHQVDRRRDQLIEPEVAPLQRLGAGLEPGVFEDGIDQRQQRIAGGRGGLSWRRWPSSSRPSSSSCSTPITPLSGVRSSWLTTAEEARLRLVGELGGLARALRTGVLLPAPDRAPAPARRCVRSPCVRASRRSSRSCAAIWLNCSPSASSSSPVLIASRLFEIAAADARRALRQRPDRNGHAPAQQQRRQDGAAEQRGEKQRRAERSTRRSTHRPR